MSYPCAEPKCKKKITKTHKWGMIKAHNEGWYQQKNGTVWCPDHRPEWAPVQTTRG